MSLAVASPWRRWWRRAALAVVLAILLTAGYFARQVILVGNGYVAKTMCSAVYVSGRKPQAVRDAEIRLNDPGILRLVSADVERSSRTVRSAFLGLGERVAVYRDGLGCTLALGVGPGELSSRGLPANVAALPARGTPWAVRAARAAAGSPALDPPLVTAAVDEAFAEPGPVPTRRTRAVVIVQDGRLVAERYGADFGPGSALPGWSMTKSVMNALTGVLARDGKLALDAPVSAPEWRAAGDPRRAVTLRQLLHMSSGLAFTETYGNPLGDVIWMLFGTGDAAGYAARKPLAAPPGQRWSYSSGTTNILARALRGAVGGAEADYQLFPRRALFEPLGMTSAVIEPDAAGTFVGSSLMFATARDWARFGLLFLQDGTWEGRRLLPEGWVTFSVTPAPAAPDGVYGAHFWLRLGRGYAPSGEHGLPPDTYHAIGHEGQILTVIPSQRLVVVRLGLSVGRGAWDHAAFLRRLLGAG